MGVSTLGARLYHANVRVATWEAVFGLDRKTLRQWGLALRSGNREWLAGVLAGRRDYRRRFVQELERVFGVKVSGETLRSVLGSLREEGKGAAGRGEGMSPRVGALATGASEGGKAESDGGATPPSGSGELNLRAPASRLCGPN